MSSIKKVDYIVVGQGLAGTLLAYCLLKKNCRVVVIESDNKRQSDFGGQASSGNAAGIINPITGKRFVKSWMIDALLPVARQTYQDIEQELGIKIWYDRLLFRTVKSIEEENQWLLKSSYPEYRAYCSNHLATFPKPQQLDEQSINEWNNWSKSLRILEELPALAVINQAAQVHLPVLIQQFRRYLIDLGIFLHQTFDFSKLKTDTESVQYEGITASKIIFCEGAKAVENPYFNWLPFNLDKGELLIVKIPDFKLTHLFKHHLTIAPVGGNMYWVGATNEWNFKDSLPTSSNKNLIVNELHQILKVPFEVIQHLAAIRPTVKDRRPFIGFHPHQSALAIFNGFGTKGASLAPYWAQHFSEILSRLINSSSSDIDEKLTLPKDVDINRISINR